jgi:hypothetical protein
MMMSRREWMIGVIAGAVLGLLVLDQIVLTPLMNRLDTATADLDAAQLKLQENTQTIARSQTVRRGWRDRAGNTLQSDASTAESQVLNRMRDWSQQAGVSLTALKPERTDREKGFTRITIRATATGNMQQVSRLIYLVGRSDVPLRISEVSINSRREGTDDLQLSIAVATIYLPPPAPSGTTVALLERNR